MVSPNYDHRLLLERLPAHDRGEVVGSEPEKFKILNVTAAINAIIYY